MMMNPTPLPPPYIQYHIRSGFLRIVGDSGDDFGAFSARPMLGKHFPGVVLMHDWWGLNANIRLLTDQLGQAGFVVVAPDLFDGQTASTPQDAQALMRQFDEARAYKRMVETMDVLRKNHSTGQKVGVVGVGLGGGFAFKAAAMRANVQAVVACSGFPQRWLGKLDDGSAPILALYGESDPLIAPEVIDALRAELNGDNRVVELPGLHHDLWPEDPTPAESVGSLMALRHIAHFFDTWLADTKRR
ncbi:MAG: dienelactone hydrolase family protein [Anaerolineae bacterium]|jgi:carboxymethylenebutenolidase|nr:dienelactone hydrolase family protein [Anaerolineae bacterium]